MIEHNAGRSVGALAWRDDDIVPSCAPPGKCPSGPTQSSALSGRPLESCRTCHQGEAHGTHPGRMPARVRTRPVWYASVTNPRRHCVQLMMMMPCAHAPSKRSGQPHQASRKQITAHESLNLQPEVLDDLRGRCQRRRSAGPRLALGVAGTHLSWPR